MPARTQRRRTAGWTKGDAVIVDRTSRFGNPFRITHEVIVECPKDSRVWTCGDPARARKWATELYRAWIGGADDDTFTVGSRAYSRSRVLADLHLLRGRDLACPCPLPAPGEPDHCHASVLLELSNRPT